MKRCTLLFLSAWFTLLVSGAAQASRLVDRSVVTVNGDVILESDIDSFLHKMRSKSYQELFGGVDEKMLKDREAVLQVLVEEKIINQQVKKLDLQATDQEVDGQIKAIVKRNGISALQLGERLKQLGTSMDDYREGLKRQVERRNLIEREIKPSLEVTDEQLRHFYLRNAKTEDMEPVYRIAHILVEPKEKGGVSSEARAKKIWAEVSQSPQNFDKFAKEYSDDTDSSANGGLLGDFSQSSLSQEFRNVVPKTAAGSVTSPLKTKAGYHIVKVLEVKKGDFASLPKERREAIRAQMVGAEVEKKMALWLERKKMEAHIQRSQPNK